MIFANGELHIVLKIMNLEIGERLSFLLLTAIDKNII